MAEELKRKGGELWAISTDREADAANMAHETGLPALFLSDARLEAIRRFDLVHEGGGPNGTSIAVPAHLLYDRGGRLVWEQRAKLIQDRPDPADVLDRVKRLGNA